MQGGGRRELQLGGQCFGSSRCRDKAGIAEFGNQGGLAGRPCSFFWGLIDRRRGRDLGVEGACFRDCELWVGCVGCGG